MADWDGPKQYKMELIVESASNDTGLIQRDIHDALAKLGFYPHTKNVERIR